MPRRRRGLASALRVGARLVEDESVPVTYATVAYTSHVNDTSPILHDGEQRGAKTVDALVVHDYLTQRGGAERVALMMARNLGANKITTSVFAPAATFSGFEDVEVTELAPRVPGRFKTSRTAVAPFAAMAFARHAAEAEVVLASSSGWSHWSRTAAPTVIYCHTPPRWFWAPDDYFADFPRPLRDLAILTSARGRRLDRFYARRHERYLANSSVVQRRIQDAYGLDSEVLHPPVSFSVEGGSTPVDGVEQGFVLMIARNRGYKNIDIATEVFLRNNVGQLVVVGASYPGVATGGRVVRTGRVSDEQLRWLYLNCRAVMALSFEDFGLTPVEGHQFGKPTIALRAGGYLDSCTEGVNAVFTDDLTLESVGCAVHELDRAGLQEGTVRASAERFSVAAFIRRLRTVLAETAGVPEDEGPLVVPHLAC
jgi:glycosyltransferase involved in cell wall biosynthesis